jgi:hypothetical protein
MQAAKVTSAFSFGFKPRILERKAKYIWQNPFFQENGKFTKESIFLGEHVTHEEHIYRSLNADVELPTMSLLS